MAMEEESVFKRANKTSRTLPCSFVAHMDMYTPLHSGRLEDDFGVSPTRDFICLPLLFISWDSAINYDMLIIFNILK